MTRHLVFLRGVNVGAHNRIRMGDLRAALEARGFEDVATQGQSGNVVLGAAGRPPAVARAVETCLADDLGVPVRVVVRGVAEVGRILAADPFAEVADDPSKHFVVFFAKAPPAAAVRRAQERDIAPDLLAFGRREAYVWCPNGLTGSRVARLRLDESLGVAGTARNVRTVGKLLAVAADDL